ncbi:MAG: hypothetical protein J5758_07400 [Abditibacteriota bacterium]|nr:hypothetical protein [Abditibacteriota bacterium]
MKLKVIVFTLIAVLAASVCFGAEGYKLKMNRKAGTRYTYKAKDDFNLKSATAYNRSLLDQPYELKADSMIYERPLSVDKYGNAKLKSYVDFKKVEINDRNQPLKTSGDYQVAIFSPRNEYKSVVQTSIQGVVKDYDGTNKSKYPVFVSYLDMASAILVLPKDEVQIGEKWYPETLELENNGYIKSEFAITQVKEDEGEVLAYIHGQANAVVDVASAVRFFRKVIPADLISKRYTGTAQINFSDINVVFSVTKGIVKKLELDSAVNMTITDPSNGMTITAYLEADQEKEFVSQS